jgi:hypothetical protein
MFWGIVDRSIGMQRLQLDLAALENILLRLEQEEEGAARLELKGKLYLLNNCITLYQLIKSYRKLREH